MFCVPQPSGHPLGMADGLVYQALDDGSCRRIVDGLSLQSHRIAWVPYSALWFCTGIGGPG